MVSLEDSFFFSFFVYSIVYITYNSVKDMFYLLFQRNSQTQSKNNEAMHLNILLLAHWFGCCQEALTNLVYSRNGVHLAGE